MEETAAMARLKQSYQQQQQKQQQSSQGNNRPPRDLVSPKMRKVLRRLEDLQDEKAKLEEMIHKLNSRKQKQQELLQRQREYHQATAAAPTKNSSDDDLLPFSNDEDGGYGEPKKSRKQKLQNRNGKKNNYSINYAASSVVSSLQSRAASYESNDDDGSDEDGYNDGHGSDDASVMAGSINNTSYRYDARGRRILEDDLLETGTTAACFQNVTGTNNHTSHETMIPSFSDHSNSTQNKGKKSKMSKVNPEETAEAEPPRVTIEWKRGISYVPEANLAYEGGGGADNVYLHHHATDLSLLVVEDNSYWDDLSLSSGEDSCLAAAEPDVPMVLNLSAKQGDNGDDEWSVQSELHSECSVSVAVAPFTNDNNAAANNNDKKEPAPSISASSQSKSSRRRAGGGGGAGGIPANHLNPNHAPALSLYQRTNTNEMDESNDKAVPMKDASSSTQQKSPRRKKENGKKDRNDDDDLPPPLTTDMSLVDSKHGDDNDSQNKTSAAPPIEISFSEEGGKDDDGLVSLGSAMCGVSVTQQDQAPSSQEPTTGTALPTTISHSNDTIKTKVPVEKSKQSTTASKKEKKNKSTTDKNANGTNGTANPAKISTKKTKKKKAKK